MTEDPQITNLLTWENIHSWAEAQPEQGIIGATCRSTMCPIATYLQEKTAREWCVYSTTIFSHPGLSVTPARWLRRVINEVDRTHLPDVRRERFLVILSAYKPTEEVRP